MANAPGYGVICFKKPAFTYFVKEAGVELATLRGEIVDDAMTAKVKGFRFALKRVKPASPTAPVARGTLYIGQRKIPIVGYNNGSSMGITADAPRDNDPCPW